MAEYLVYLLKKLFWKQESWLEAAVAEHEKVLLSVVGHLPVLEVKFMHEGLAVKKVVKGLIPDLKKPRTQTQEASL